MITTTVDSIPTYTITVRCKNCNYYYVAATISPIEYKYYCRKHMIDFNGEHRTYVMKEYIDNGNRINNQSK